MAGTALCIGINYAGSTSPLDGCINDMNDWAGVLKGRGFAVTVLEEAQATKANIRRGLEEVLSKVGKDEMCVITYSGHGSYVADANGDEPDGRDEVWCPYDYSGGSYVTDDEIYELLRQAKPGARVVILTDSCFNGTVSKFTANVLTKELVRAPRVRFLPPAQFLKGEALQRAKAASSLPPKNTRPDLALLLSGSSDEEYSYDAWFNDRANGAFTFHALRTLKELPAGADFATWWSQIRKWLPTPTHPQRPQLVGSKAQREWKVF